MLCGILYGNSRILAFGSMKWNQPLWFLPCMFVTLIITYCFEKAIGIIGNKNPLRCVMIALSIISTFILEYYFNGTQGLPFGFEVAVFMFGFVEIGIVLQEIRVGRFGNKIHSLKNCSFISFMGILAGILFLIIATSYYNGFGQVRDYEFGKLFCLYVITAILGTIATLLLSIRIEKCCFLEEIGRNSLFILLFHKFPILFFQSVLPFTKRLLNNGDGVVSNLAGIALTVIVAFSLVISQRILGGILSLIRCYGIKNSI